MTSIDFLNKVHKNLDSQEYSLSYSPATEGINGTIARLYPSRAHSATRLYSLSTGRISPVKPISPITTVPSGSGLSKIEPATASVIARSAPLSSMRMPPTAFV